MSEFNIWIAAGVFTAYLAVDALYAMYTISVVKRRAVVSANISFAMHFLLAVGVLSYVENFWYVVPLAMGSWVGTFIATKYFDMPRKTVKNSQY